MLIKQESFTLTKFIIYLFFIAVFFSDYGLFYTEFTRPMISFCELLGFLIIIISFKKINRISLKAVQMFSISIIIIIISIFSSFIYDNNMIENLKSSVRILYWVVLLIMLSQYKTIKKEMLLKIIMSTTSVIALLGILQFVIYRVFGYVLKFRPNIFGEVRWGNILGLFRPTSIYAEPSWLAVALIPFAFASFSMYIKKDCSLFTFLILNIGVLISFSFGGIITLGAIYTIYFIYLFLINFLSKRFNVRMFVIFLVIVTVFISFNFQYGFLENLFYRISSELARSNSSISKRLSGYEGIIEVAKESPIFGSGFLNYNFFKTEGLKYQASVGISTLYTGVGLFGTLLFIILLKIILVHDKKSKYKYIKNSLLFALVVEQTIVYGGIFNTDFWGILAIIIMI